MMRGMLALGACLSLASSSRAQEEVTVEFKITGGKQDAVNVPITVPLRLPRDADKTYWLKQLKGDIKPLGQQVTKASLVLEARDKANDTTAPFELHLLLAELKAGQTVTMTAILEKSLGAIPMRRTPWFYWKADKGFTELVHGPAGAGPYRPILRYMHQAYDDSSMENRDKTYKVFHHLYDPAGKRFVTNGGHTDAYDDPKALLYPHHRGLQMGFNKCIYDDGKKRADTWHCQKDDHQSHEGILRAETGPLLGRHRVAIDWHGEGKKVFLKEVRELTAYHMPGGTLIEFAARLKPVSGPVKLDGDPQHAGFQFRAHNDVAAKTAKQTYYLRPDGKGELGATRNWEPKTKLGPINLPWNAMSFVLDDKRYTVCYIDHPRNPGEKRYSERDYGRFGCYFEYDLTEDRPLVVHYRVWLQEGEMTVDQVQALANQFVNAPKVTASIK